MPPTSPFVAVTRLRAPRDRTQDLLDDVRTGLTAEPPELPPKWLYDARGSELFEAITRLEVYYPTRAETEILQHHADEIMDRARPEELVELGSGSSTKTQLLLEAMHRGGHGDRYVPLDVSEEAIIAAADSLRVDHPWLEVHGYVGDFLADLPDLPRHGRRLLAFLGSTIGNLDVAARAELLAAVRTALRPEDRFLLGADLVKDEATLLAAYDDPDGVTADFDRNLLHVLRRDAGAEVDIEAFRHEARWVAEEERIELWLVATRPTRIAVPAAGVAREFAPGEGLRTELSCKFRRDGVTAELRTAGLDVEAWWTDRARRFALTLTRPT